MDVVNHQDMESISKTKTTTETTNFSPSSSSSSYHSIKLGSSMFTVDKRYINLEPQGDGSYGFVVSAYDIIRKRPVAIKKIKDTCSNILDAKRILRELKLLRHFSYHENIIAIYDIMTDPTNTSEFRDIYIVTNLFESDLERIISSNQPLTDHHFRFFIYQILRALKYVHSANVLHRDLKPSNILVNANCDVSICDFGLSRGFDTSSHDPLTEYVVTRWYRAPELLCDSPYYGKAVDMWSVGCILAELINHKPLFRGQNPQHQLQCIVQMLGCPPREKLDFIQSKAALSVIRKSAPRETPHFSTLFPKDTSFLALDLLQKILEFHPDDRVTVEEALEHPYLRDFHRVLPEPSCKDIFNFEFEIPILPSGSKKDLDAKGSSCDESQTQCSDFTGYARQPSTKNHPSSMIEYTNDLSVLTPEQLQAMIYDEVLLYRQPNQMSNTVAHMDTLNQSSSLTHVTGGVEDMTKYTNYSSVNTFYSSAYPHASNEQPGQHQSLQQQQFPNQDTTYMYADTLPPGTVDLNQAQGQYMYQLQDPQFMQQYSDQHQQLSSLDIQTAMEVAALLGENTPPRDQLHLQQQQMYTGSSFPTQGTYISGSTEQNQQYNPGSSSWMMDQSQSSSQYIHSQSQQPQEGQYSHHSQSGYQNSANFPSQYGYAHSKQLGTNAPVHMSGQQNPNYQYQWSSVGEGGSGGGNGGGNINNNSGVNSDGHNSRTLMQSNSGYVDASRSGSGSSGGNGNGNGETTINVKDDDLNRLLAMSFDASMEGSREQMDI